MSGLCDGKQRIFKDGLALGHKTVTSCEVRTKDLESRSHFPTLIPL